MPATASGTFDIDLTPAAAELDGAGSRFEFRKIWRGDLDATSAGLMISGGDPASGSAGYVAFEAVRGSLAGRTGSFAFQQYGRMHSGGQSLVYEIVPGSGEGELAGIAGILELTVIDGEHTYVLSYDL